MDTKHTDRANRELPENYNFQDYARGWNDSLDLSLDIVEAFAQNLHREGKHDSARDVLRLIDKMTPTTPKLNNEPA